MPTQQRRTLQPICTTQAWQLYLIQWSIRSPHTVAPGAHAASVGLPKKPQPAAHGAGGGGEAPGACWRMLRTCFGSYTTYSWPPEKSFVPPETNVARRRRRKDVALALAFLYRGKTRARARARARTVIMTARTMIMTIIELPLVSTANPTAHGDIGGGRDGGDGGDGGGGEGDGGGGEGGGGEGGGGGSSGGGGVGLGLCPPPQISSIKVTHHVQRPIDQAAAHLLIRICARGGHA